MAEERDAGEASADEQPAAGVVATVPVFNPDDFVWKPVPQQRTVAPVVSTYKDAEVDLGALYDNGFATMKPTVLYKADSDACLFYKGMTNCIIGPSESLKSWILLLAAYQEIRAQHKVMLFDFEDSAQASVGRLARMGITRDEAVAYLKFFKPTAAFNDADKEYLMSIHIEEFALVGIDAVTEAMSLQKQDGRNENEVASYFQEMPSWIAEMGPAVVLVDHMNRNVDSNTDGYAVGSQHKKNVVTGVNYTIASLTKMSQTTKILQETDGHSRIDIAKDKRGGVDWTTIGKSSKRFAGYLHIKAEYVSETEERITVWVDMNSPVSVIDPADHTNTGTGRGTSAVDKKAAMVTNILDFIESENDKGKMPSGSTIADFTSIRKETVLEMLKDLEHEGDVKNAGTEARPKWMRQKA